MLESVRSQLAEVRDTVGALRALVSETKEPPSSSVAPPLPPPREPPPPLETDGILAYPWQCARLFADRYSMYDSYSNMILIQTWKMRLDLSSQSQTRRRCL